MKKLLIFFIVPLYTAFCVCSCKRTSIIAKPSNEAIMAKVNTWLDVNKPENNPGQVANIDLLKSNLEYSELHIEESSQNEQIIIIPINEKLKKEKGIDPYAVPNLVVIVDASGQIRKGNIVLYFPENRGVNRVPNNTFHAILNTAKPHCNGTFRYLSVAGRTLYELAYQDGRLKSFRKKTDAIHGVTTTANTANACIDWYWIYTEYDEWGTIVDEWEEYIGTTCQSESCADPYIASECPMDHDEGGGDPEDYEVETLKVTTLDWTVQYIPQESGSGLVRESSRLVGRFYKKNTQNNHFVGLQGSSLTLVLSNWGGNGDVAWSNTVSTGTVNSSTRMTLNSSGRINFPNSEHYNYAGSKVVSMSDCYWPI